MARIYPLFSSSKGNSTYIGSKNAGILVDAGVTYKRLLEGFSRSGLDFSAVQAIFITHNHIDHIKGLSVLTKNWDIPIYAQEKTLKYLVDNEMIYSSAHEMNGAVTVGGMEISCFCTPHDTEQSCGYRIHTEDGKKCAVCTDLGEVTSDVAENLNGCDLVLLESNYDENMLRNGPYPYTLKKRISSAHGHLSNNACGEQAKMLISGGTTRIILGHLSQENNTPAIADRTVEQSLSGFTRNRDYLLEVAPVETIGKCMVF